MIGEQVRRITGVALADGGKASVTLSGDNVGAITPADKRHGGGGAGEPGDLHLPGWLLLPGATEPHAHLDKALCWPHVPPVYGDLRTAIDTWRAYAETLTADDVRERARRALARYLANGFTAVRTHLDLLPGGDPLRGVHALLELRDEVAGLLDLQLALLTRPDTPDALVKDAVGLGVDVVGGCPHLTDDPAAETARLLAIAEALDVPVDLHTDEQLNPEALSLRDLCDQVRALDFGPRVTASHCVSLGALAPDALAEIVARIKAAGIGIVTLPQTNLYLQARERHHDQNRPRGITALHALSAAGIPVAAGGDNLRDPFNPMGRADPFETTSLLITAGHLDAAAALTAVTAAGRTVLGLPPAGPSPGARADLLAVRADSLADALAGPGDARAVIHRGRLTALTTVRRLSALPEQRDHPSLELLPERSA